MTLSDQFKVIYSILSVNLLIGAQAGKVYFDKYGHCIHDDFSLDDEIYTVLPRGGGMIHESLHCDLTFKARPDHGICITFKNFNINDCGVKLKIFDKNHVGGKSWKTLDCNEESPKRMCTGKRYVTIALHKAKLNKNKNYNFNLLVSESNGDFTYTDDGQAEEAIGETFTGENVFFASLGIFLAIIVGVIVLIISIAVLIICCCCKGRQRQRGQQYQATSTSPPTQPQAQPSAPPPPAPTDYFSNQANVPPLYPALPPQYQRTDAPPPYTPQAPSYSQPGYAPQSAYTGEPEVKQPVV